MDILSPQVQAPYLAAKISTDTWEYCNGLRVNLKFLKLKADFIRYFLHLGNDEFHESVNIAAHWEISDCYLLVLKSVLHLLPEYNLDLFDDGEDQSSYGLLSHVKVII